MFIYALQKGFKELSAAIDAANRIGIMTSLEKMQISVLVHIYTG